MKKIARGCRRKNGTGHVRHSRKIKINRPTALNHSINNEILLDITVKNTYTSCIKYCY